MFSITGFLIACLIHHSAYGLPDTQIVGGSDAKDGAYPYHVSLKAPFTNAHICSGAIISTRYVITAAHCLANRNESDIRIDVGSIQLFSPETTYEIEKLILHPNYTRETKDNSYINDIGLIRLKKDIKFTANTKLIKIISDDPKWAFFEGKKLTVTGWGKLSKDNSYIPLRLQHLNVTGCSKKLCSDHYKNISDSHICTIEGWDKGMCDGDDGSPLTYKNELIGIWSFGVPCAIGYPDVFTRVYHYKSWIKEHTNAASNQQLNIIFALFLMYLSVYSFL
ncbi:chymotrypsin-2 [Monomorium pharaonis]|uniref:chymotrypsin-2 n=1 Tax=Monomorium pharaonis TaxID=307658 RepID=UPI00063F7729|nr:chymotrypsin-2 [Monomorium pharaonis]